MQRMVPRVAPKYLLLLAGIFWMFAGGNILRIGIPDFVANWTQNILYLLIAIVVFAVFMVFIFYRLVQKHNTRIMSMEKEKVPVFHFFDRKSYLIMIFMITGGLLIRSAHLFPAIVIGVLYCGIGVSLEGAGILFLHKFIRAMQCKEIPEEE